MKNKKGFTIPELLGVIVILGILATIATGSYNAISNRMKEKTLQNKLALYKEAAYEYAADNEIENETITIGYLGELGYIELEHPDAIRNERIDNPVTGEYLDCRVLNISRNLDDYEITDTGKYDCVFAENEHQQSEINTKAFIYVDGKFTNLTSFEIADYQGEFSNNNETNIDDIVGGLIAGATAGAGSGSSSSGSISGAIGGAAGWIIGSNSGSLNGFWENIFKKWNWSNFFHILIPVVNAESTKNNNYTTYPWSKSDVYVFFDFNNTRYTLKNNEVVYDVGNVRTTQTGKICNSISLNGCANVFQVETSLIFDNYVVATVNTDYGKISKKVRVRIDKELPTARIDYEKKITKNNIKINLDGSDGSGSGIAGYYFGTKDNPTAAEFNDFNQAYINSNGKYYYAVIDNAGNISKVESVIINEIDKEGPQGFVKPTSRDSWSEDDFTFSFGCSSDTKSGCAKKITYSIFNDSTNSYIVKDKTVEETETSYTVTTPRNTRLKSVTLTFDIYDNIGNVSHKSQSITTNIDKIVRYHPSWGGSSSDDDDDDDDSPSSSNGSSNSGGGGSSGSAGGCHSRGECAVAGATAGATIGAGIGGAAGAVIGAAVGGAVGWVLGG